MRVIFSSKAIADIDRLTAFGADRWGIAAADEYANELREHVKILKDNFRLYPVVELEGVDVEIRSVRHRRHRVFYVVSGDAIRILRVLDQQADWSHLVV